MSESVNLNVYYGAGNVRYNELGVDLSEFKNGVMTLADPDRLDIRQLKYWLTTSFGLDPEVCSVSIHALWTKSCKNVKWELMPVDRSQHWLSLLRRCRDRRIHPYALVQPVPKEENTVQLHRGYEPGQGSEVANEIVLSGSQPQDVDASQPEKESDYVPHNVCGPDTGQSSQSIILAGSGFADGDEEGDEMQRVMEEEDEDGLVEELDSENSEDEVEVPIPSAWEQDISTGLTVNDGHETPWQYNLNQVQIGAMFDTKKKLKYAVIKWAMSTQRVFKTHISSPTNYTVKCVVTGCPGKVHGHVPKYDIHWVVTIVVPHNCVRKNLLVKHPNLTSSLIAQLMYTEIVEKKDMEAKHIQTAVKVRWNYVIPYGKAWRAKQKAMEERFGTFFDSYDNVVRLLGILKERNPGTYVNVQHMRLLSIPDFKVLKRVFFSFAMCIEAFRHCPPVMFVDGTFLTGQYRGQILTAIGVDGNNQIIPLAMAFVEGENFLSWVWFFRQVKIAIVKDRPNVCVIHDRHAGILKAVKTLRNPTDDEPTPWRDLQSRWCMRHLGANFFSQFKNKRLMNLFKKLCKQSQQRKYEFIWSKLDEFTKKQVRARKKMEEDQVKLAALIAELEEPVGLCDLPAIDPPNTKRKKGRAIKNFSEWIEKEPPVNWSLLHDTHGARYGHMTTNLAEVYNFVLRGNRALPLTAIVEAVFHGTLRYFRERHELAKKHIEDNQNTPYCSRVMEYMAKKIEKAKKHTVRLIGNQERRYEVQLPTDGFGSGNEVKTHEVKIGTEFYPTCECTCNKPKLLHLPCSHVLAACGQIELDAISFVSPYYLKEAVLNTWTGEMTGFRVVGNFNKVNDGERVYIPHPDLRRTSRGRRKARRIRNDMDQSEAGGATRQCLLCAAYGHRMKYCPDLNKDGASTSTSASTSTAATTGARGGRGRGSRGRRGGRGRNNSQAI